MSVVEAAEGTAATEGVEAAPSGSSPIGVLRRNASTASIASVHQSFLDAEPAVQSHSFSTRVNNPDTFKANPVSAAATLLLPVAHPAEQLRAVHGHTWVNTRQAFFDDDGEAELQRDGARDNNVHARATMVVGAAKNEETTLLSPPPLSSLGTQGGSTNLKEGCDTIQEVIHNDISKYTDSVDPDYTRKLKPASQTDFTCQYAQSSNPYLRAVVTEMKESLDEAFEMREDEGFILGKEKLAPMFALVNSTKDTNRGGVNRGGSPSFVQSFHRAPQLSRPLGSSLPLNNAAQREVFTAFSNLKDGAALPSSPPLRGIPLFTRTWRQSSRLAPSSTPSLRQSVEEYGQLQLQDEAVHWYHRSSELEQQLARLQGAYDRQAKLLLAAQSNMVQYSTSVNAAHTDPKEDGRRTKSVSKTPFYVRGDLAAALTSTDDSVDRMTALTSRSPDSLSRAYLNEEGTEAYANGEVVEADSARCSHTARREATLANVTETTMRYTVPKPYLNEEGGRPLECASYDNDATTGRAVYFPHCSLVRRGEVEEPTDKSANTPVAEVVEAPTCTTITGQTNDGAHAISTSFTREDGEALQTESTNGAGDASSSPSIPSAILAKQYTEMVNDMKSMQVRLDVAEREAENLREMCVAQDLRCDDLETQLLAKEEQLLRYTQQPSSAKERATSPSCSLDSTKVGKENNLSNEDVETCAADAEKVSVVTRAVHLKPLITLLAEFLDSVRRMQNDFPLVKEALETDKKEAPSEGQAPLCIHVDSTMASTERVLAPSANVETDNVDDATQLASLVSQAHHVLRQVFQQHAALQAELEVVRADRNELIGEQSEQVRLLQQQLLEKDTEQLQLMERLHSAQERIAAADVARRSETDGPESLNGTPASPIEDVHSAHGGERPAPTNKLPERAAAEDNNNSRALAEQVEELTTQLAEAKAAAAAAQAVQRNVLTERLEQAQTELKRTRLRAEDEYDRLSDTIEGLTRELAETKEALRNKEVSLRIALRESSPAMLLAASGEPPRDTAFDSFAVTTQNASYFAAGPQWTSPPALPQLLPTISQVSTEATTGHAVGEEVVSERSSSASPSPPPAPSFPPHLRALEPEEISRMTRNARKNGTTNEAHLRPPSSKPHNQEQQRGKKFVDDGTLRTLPSSIPLDADEYEDDKDGHQRAASASAVGRFVLSSSREKSSRGLTTSTGAGSHTTSWSLPRGRSSAASSYENVLAHVQPSLEAAPIEEATQATQSEVSRSIGNSLPSIVKDASTDAGEPSTHHDEALTPATTTPPKPAAATVATRRSASARIVDSLIEEDELPLPLPLRSPLFRHPPSPSSAASTSPSPLHGETLTSQLPEELARPIYRASNASSPLPSPLENGLQQRTKSSSQRQQQKLFTSSLSPDERLRRFFNSSADIATSFNETVTTPYAKQMNATPNAQGQTQKTSEADATPMSTFKEGQATTTRRNGARLVVPGDGATSARTPISLLSERTSTSPPSVDSTPSFGFEGSPHISEAAARHTQVSLRRHREVWQRQEALLRSLLSSPSP